MATIGDLKGQLLAVGYTVIWSELNLTEVAEANLSGSGGGIPAPQRTGSD